MSRDNSSAACIYCGSNADGNEHWLPRALGNFKGFTYLENVICQACNERLGRLDEELVRVGPEGVFREFAGVEGRSAGKSPNPVYYRGATTNPTRLEIVAAGQGDDNVLLEPYRDESGAPRARPARQLGLRNAQGNTSYLPLNLNWTVDTLREALKSRNLELAQLVEVYVDDEEKEAAQRLLSPIFPDFRAELFSRDGSVETKKVLIRHDVRVDYFRALCKVAFHSALKLAPFLDGSGPEFEPIRLFIDKGQRLEANPVSEVHEPLISNIPLGMAPAQYVHIVTVDVNSDRIEAQLQFFLGPGVRPLQWRIDLAPNTRTHAEFHKGIVAAIDSEPQPHGFDGELIPLISATADEIEALPALIPEGQDPRQGLTTQGEHAERQTRPSLENLPNDN